MPGYRSSLFQNLPPEFQAVGLPQLKGGRNLLKMADALARAVALKDGSLPAGVALEQDMPQLIFALKGLAAADAASSGTAVLYGKNLLGGKGFPKLSHSKVTIVGGSQSITIESAFPGKYSNFILKTKIGAFTDTSAGHGSSATVDKSVYPPVITWNIDNAKDAGGTQAWSTALDALKGTGVVNVSISGFNTTDAIPTLGSLFTALGGGTLTTHTTDAGDGPGFRCYVGELLIQDTTQPGPATGANKKNEKLYGLADTTAPQTRISRWTDNAIYVVVNKGRMVSSTASLEGVFSNVSGENVSAGGILPIRIEFGEYLPTGYMPFYVMHTLVHVYK